MLGKFSEVISSIFWIPVGLVPPNCDGLGFAHNQVTVHARGCTGTTVNQYEPVSLARKHLLLASNDTVPILMWRGEGKLYMLSAI